MRKLFLVLIPILIICSPVYAQNKTIQIRLVLEKEEIDNVPHDSYFFEASPLLAPEIVFLDKEILFSNSDIKQITILEKEQEETEATPRIVVYLKDENKDKFAQLTKKYLKRELAIMVDGKIFALPKILDPIDGGVVKILIGKIKTVEEAEALVKDLGFEPMPDESYRKLDFVW